MSSVFMLTLRQLGGGLRLAIMAVLATLPVVIASINVRIPRAPSAAEFETYVLNAMLSGSITPLVVLAIATTAFGHEVEDRTLANLTLSPVPRWQIALPKLLATATIAAAFIGASALVTTHVAFVGDTTATVAVTLSAIVAVSLYAAFFVWLGLVTTQAIAIGLLYIVLWEGFFSGFVSGVRVLSIRHYSISLMHGLDPRRFSEADTLGLGMTLAVSAAVLGGFLLLTSRKLRRMDVP